MLPVKENSVIIYFILSNLTIESNDFKHIHKVQIELPQMTSQQWKKKSPLHKSVGNLTKSVKNSFLKLWWRIQSNLYFLLTKRFLNFIFYSIGTILMFHKSFFIVTK